MARAIDADALREEFADILDRTYTDDYAKGFVAGIYAALNMPTLTQPNEWVSVKERLPELPDFAHCDRMVITCDWKGHVAPMYWERRTIRGKSIERWRYHFDRIYDGFGITHWMPLPAPPDRRPPEGEEETK